MSAVCGAPRAAQKLRPTAHATSATSLGGAEPKVWINPELPPDMGEFRRIREALVRHHLPQSDQPRFREEEAGNRGRCIKTHQAAINQVPGRRRQLRLSLLRATSPDSELKASAKVGNVPKNWSSSRRIYSRSLAVSAAMEVAADAVMVAA